MSYSYHKINPEESNRISGYRDRILKRNTNFYTQTLDPLWAKLQAKYEACYTSKCLSLHSESFKDKETAIPVGDEAKHAYHDTPDKTAYLVHSGVDVSGYNSCVETCKEDLNFCKTELEF
jgi:hypothetical protein